MPLFVCFPTTRYAGQNFVRTQYCSSVDFFGLIAGLAGLTGWQTDNPQLAARQNMLGFLQSGSSPSTRTLSSTNQQLNGQPYILHTSDEPYADEDGAAMYDTSGGLASHVVGIKTSVGKLAFNTVWQQGTTGPANGVYPSPPVPGNAANEEFYDYANLGNTGETGNNYSSSNPSALQTAMETALKGMITSELQATLPTVSIKGVQVNLANVQTSAEANYWAYLSPPSGLSITPSNPVHSSSYQSFTATGVNIQKSANVTINNGGTVDPASIQVTPTSSVTFSAIVPSAGAYTVTVTNPSKQSATVSLTAS